MPGLEDLGLTKTGAYTPFIGPESACGIRKFVARTGQKQKPITGGGNCKD